jgi:hypothetical protein
MSVQTKESSIGQKVSHAWNWCWEVDRLSMQAGLFFAIGAVATAILLGVDGRTLLGENVWLKPFKFFCSSMTLSFSLPYVLSFIVQPFPGSKRWISRILNTALLTEMVLISLQAARGVRSHFNQRTVFDQLAFGAMGTAIAVLFVTAIWLSVRLFQTRIDQASSAAGAAVRWGMVLFVLGSSTGWIMTQPRPAQMQLLKQGVLPQDIGSHTIGAPDGSPGIPLTGWSKVAGDIRVSHFVGLHGLQVLILGQIVLLLLGVGLTARKYAVGLWAGGVAILYLTSLAQALSAKSLIDLGGAFGPAFALGVLMILLPLLLVAVDRAIQLSRSEAKS